MLGGFGDAVMDGMDAINPFDSGGGKSPQEQLKENKAKERQGLKEQVGQEYPNDPLAQQQSIIDTQDGDNYKALKELHSYPESTVDTQGGLATVTPGEGGGALVGLAGPSKRLGDITRSQYYDYVKRIRPFEDALMDMTNDPQTESRMRDRVRQDMNQAYGGMAEQQEQRLQGFGLSMTDAQKTATNRRNALDKAAATAGGMNKASTAIRDRNQAAMAGGLGSLAKTRKDQFG